MNKRTIIVLFALLLLSACGANPAGDGDAAPVESATPDASGRQEASAGDADSEGPAQKEPFREEPAGEKSAQEEPVQEKPAREKTIPDEPIPEESAQAEPVREESPPEQAAEPKAPPPARTYRVEIVNFAFTPQEIEIEAGTSVEFINLDDIQHTATDDNGAFDTGLLAKGESKTVTFDKAGEYGYYCIPHPGMRGKIIVK